MTCEIDLSENKEGCVHTRNSGVGFVKLGVLGELLGLCGNALQDEVLRTILVEIE